MNWGNKIVVAFFLFTSMVVTMVIIAMHHNVGLVAKDYYKEEINYQKQIDRITNYNLLAEKPKFRVLKGQRILEVKFPAELIAKKFDGKFIFYRPSSEVMDKEIAIQTDPFGIQRIDLAEFQAGRWRIKLSWSENNKEYFNESVLTF